MLPITEVDWEPGEVTEMPQWSIVSRAEISGWTRCNGSVTSPEAISTTRTHLIASRNSERKGGRLFYVLRDDQVLNRADDLMTDVIEHEFFD